MASKKKILSLDGGGMRGLMTTQLLIALEERIGCRIADCVDMVAGTSIGGIITAMLLHPKKYSAKDISNLFVEYGAVIFNTNAARRVLSYICESKYSAKGIEGVLDKYMGDNTLYDLTKPAIITTYDLTRRNVKIFARTDETKKGTNGNFYLKDVCRATSAAPTYFEPHHFFSLGGECFNCCDGGVSLNNPALAAHSEMLNGEETIYTENLFLVSLGTGMSLKPIHGDDYGDVQWISPVIDILMSSSSEVVDFHLAQIFKAAGVPEQYVRIEPTAIGDASWAMDCATTKQIEALIEAGREVAKAKSKKLDFIAEQWLK